MRANTSNIMLQFVYLDSVRLDQIMDCHLIPIMCSQARSIFQIQESQWLNDIIAITTDRSRVLLIKSQLNVASFISRNRRIFLWVPTTIFSLKYTFQRIWSINKIFNTEEFNKIIIFYVLPESFKSRIPIIQIHFSINHHFLLVMKPKAKIFNSLYQLAILFLQLLI